MPMKFADLIEKWKTLEPGEGGSEETCRMMRQIVLDMPAFMTVIESNYRCAGMFKSYMKSALASALEKFKSGGKLSDEPAPESILSLLDHFVEQIASKQHCTTDATILRWASVGQEVNSLPPKMPSHTQVKKEEGLHSLLTAAKPPHQKQQTYRTHVRNARASVPGNAAPLRADSLRLLPPLKATPAQTSNLLGPGLARPADVPSMTDEEICDALY